MTNSKAGDNGQRRVGAATAKCDQRELFPLVLDQLVPMPLVSTIAGRGVGRWCPGMAFSLRTANPRNRSKASDSDRRRRGAASTRRCRGASFARGHLVVVLLASVIGGSAQGDCSWWQISLIDADRSSSGPAPLPATLADTDLTHQLVDVAREKCARDARSAGGRAAGRRHDHRLQSQRRQQVPLPGQIDAGRARSTNPPATVSCNDLVLQPVAVTSRCYAREHARSVGGRGVTINVWSCSACNGCAGLADIVLASHAGTNTQPTTATAAGATEATPGPAWRTTNWLRQLGRLDAALAPRPRSTASDDDWR